MRLHDKLRIPLYRHLLDTYSGDALRSILFPFVGYHGERRGFYWSVNQTGTVALLRLALLTGMPAAEFKAIGQAIQRGSRDWDGLLHEAIFDGFDAATFERIAPESRWDLLFRAVMLMAAFWRLDMAVACDLAVAKFDADAASLPVGLRLALADLFLQRGDTARMQRALEGLNNGGAQALRAALLGQQGRYPEAQQAFEAAIKLRQVETGARKRVLPNSLVWLYPLGLNVQSERDWFRVSGQATLDDGLVLAFAALLDAARQKSRFIPMGDGVYAAPTAWASSARLRCTGW